MRVLHVLPSRAPSYGGPVHVAETLAAHATLHGHDAIVLPRTPKPPINLLGTAVYWPGWGALRDIARETSLADIVHVHGLWTIPATAACKSARRHSKPYVVTPHGMLDLWSLRRSHRKKRLYAALFERRNIEHAAALHFLNDSEREEAQEFSIQKRCFVVPNAVDPEDFAKLPSRHTLNRLVPQLHGKTIVLFLGRLHPKKGLDVLVPAFAQASARTRNLHLLIAGPDEGRYRARVEHWISSHDLKESVTLLGPMFGADKKTLLGGADIFVLPSHEEGDSIAVKEAMASQLPVVVTRQCRIPEVETRGAGLLVDPTPESIAGALAALSASRDFRRRLGLSGKRLIRDNYASARIGTLMLDTYADILTGKMSAQTWR